MGGNGSARRRRTPYSALGGRFCVVRYANDIQVCLENERLGPLE